MRKPSFSIVVAMDSQQGIGKNNNLPWSLSADLTHFKSLTTTVTHLQKRNAVIMGRKTWNSLPTAFRPLPNRLNIVITRQERENNDVTYFFKGLNPALHFLTTEEYIEKIFVIGGEQLYQEAIIHPSLKYLFVTEISGNFNCDTFFPEFKNQFQAVSQSEEQREGDLSFQFLCYQYSLS